uniref:uncharacterized protein LOC120346759 n=1 Tax=Styela clava TaxID=7725 RepID=UPI0019399CB3|nr:uncharacterized protein LOC120346759 [Styela clava]
MDVSTLEAEQASIEQDILKLQLHSVPLNLNWGEEEEEDDDYEDETSYLLSAFDDPDQPSTSGLNNYPGSSNNNAGSNNNNADVPSTSKASEEINETSHAALDSEDDDEIEYDQTEPQEELIDLSADLEANPTNLLKLNIAYQEVILQQLHLIDELLNHNKCKQADLETKLNDTYFDSGKAQARADLGLSTGQYFKIHLSTNSNSVIVPMNLHTDVLRLREEVGPHFVENPMPAKKWTKDEEKRLKTGVQRVALRKITEPLLSQLEYLEEKYAKSEDFENTKRKIKEVKQKISDAKDTKPFVLYGERSQEHDWDTIANVDVGGERGAIDVALYWKNQLHPHINHDSWKGPEDEKLKKLVKKYKETNWIGVANELGTGRTALQCIQRYQRNNIDHKSKPWTPEDDEKLTKLVQKYRCGNVIPYSALALKLGGRTNSQVCHRWTKVLDPAYIRTKWTPDEDILLLKAIAKFGTKWSIIRDSGTVPGRNDSQCRERYDNVLKNINRGPWTAEEDKIIQDMIKKHGEGQWSMVAHALDRRTDNQVFNRWKYIKKCLKSGSTMKYKKAGPKTVAEGLATVRQKLVDTIEMQIRKSKAEAAKMPIEPTEPIDEDMSLMLADESQLPTVSTKSKKIDIGNKVSLFQPLEADLQEKLENVKKPEDMVNLYHRLSAKIKRRVVSKSVWVRTDKIINQKVLKTIDKHCKPFKYEAEINGTNINAIRQKVLSTLKKINAKVMFIHYVKAMNINAEKTLQAIKDQGTPVSPTRRSKRKSLNSKTPPKADEAEANNNNTATDTSNSTTVDDKPAPNAASSTFTRNHFLPLCAPNRATLFAYRKLVNDRERRVKTAKLMLIEKNDKSKGKQNGHGTKEDLDPNGPLALTNGAIYDGKKYKPEDLMKNIQLMPEHRILRSRFVSMFAWPTVLSTLVPFERYGYLRSMRPAVRVRPRNNRQQYPNLEHNDEESEDNEEQPAAKRQKISDTLYNKQML